MDITVTRILEARWTATGAYTLVVEAVIGATVQETCRVTLPVTVLEELKNLP